MSGSSGPIAASALSMPTSGIRDMMVAISRSTGVINLAPGEPNFPTPEHIVRAGEDALLGGQTKYTNHTGILELREEISRKLSAMNGFEAGPDQIVVTHGAMGALYSTFVALVEPGDEVIIPDPAWPNFRMMATLRGATIREYPLTVQGGFLPDIDQLERLMNERTRLLLLNSPSNPLGASIPGPVLEAIIELADKHDIWVVSDEAYEAITYGTQHVSSATVDPNGRVVSVFSFSKTYSMTGWRLGYAVAEPKVAKVIGNLQEAMVSCPNAPAQWAALAALRGTQEPVAEMIAAYAHRLRLARKILDEHGLYSFDPQGAFYLWIDIRKSGISSVEFCRSLLDTHRVAVVPGSAFGPAGEGYVRASMASAEDDVVNGVTLLARHVAGVDTSRSGRQTHNG